MRFAMVFEGIDRATKVMNKIMAAEKKTATAVKTGAKTSKTSADNATRATEKQVSALNRLGSAGRDAYNKVAAGARAAEQATRRATKALHERTKALGKKGVEQVKSGGGKAVRGAVVAGGIAGAAVGGATLAATQLVDTASQFEKFQATLETTEGSSQKAKAAMAWVTDFAAKTPYELDQVMQSFVALRTMGLDPTKGLMRDLGDAAAAMNIPVLQAVEAMKDATTGENERLKELGVRGNTDNKTGEITYTYTIDGVTKTATAMKDDPLGIQKTVSGILSEKFGGAMEKLSSTWGGMVSNLSDIWTQFQLAIMSAGLFDWMKDKLKMVLDTINQLKQSGELDKWAASIGQKIQFVLESAWNFATRAYEILQKLGTHLKSAADFVGGWERLAVILAGLAIAPMLIATAVGIVQIVTGLAMLGSALAGMSITGSFLVIGAGIGKLGVAFKAMGAALMANPILLIIAAIIAAGIAIYIYWEPIKAFFVGLWDSISAGASTAWASIKEWLGFDPVAALSSAWSSVSTTISDAWAALPSLTWDNVLTALDWISWISPLRWLDFIPGFSWSGIITGAIDWAKYITSFQWTDFLPSFSWPEIPPLDLPEMPDIAGWIGGLGDKAVSAIEGVSSRLGSAWSRVKSAFSFGATAKVDVADPATIQAAQAATAALKADMQAVAAINTTGAMGQLTRLDAEAARVKQAVTGSVQQAVSYLAGISLYNQGAALMDTMAAGIRARAAVVIAEIQRMAQTVRDHLPSSPAKVGPLSDIHRLKFGETIASSIRPAPMVKAMRGAAAATMAAASISGASIPVSAQPVAGAAVRAEVAARSQSASIASGQSGGGIHIEYKPTLSLSGNVQEVKADLKKELSSHASHLANLVEEEQRKRNRRKP